MDIMASTLDAIKTHAAAEAAKQRECCGVVIVRHGKQVYLPCRNRAAVGNEFIIDEDDWVAAEDQGAVAMVVHSHVGIPPIPSQADLVGIENTKKPWLIINMPTGQHTITKPSQYFAPLIGRQFSHGVLDCYSLIRDYYKQELGITLNDYPRNHEWWRHGEDLYQQFFRDAGFEVVSMDNLQLHDVIFMRLAAQCDNHGAVYVGNNQILHHPMTRLSGRDQFGGFWRKIATTVVRHEAFR